MEEKGKEGPKGRAEEEGRKSMGPRRDRGGGGNGDNATAAPEKKRRKRGGQARGPPPPTAGLAWLPPPLARCNLITSEKGRCGGEICGTFFLSPLFFRRHALPFLKGEPSFFLLLLYLAQRSDEAAPDPPAPPPPPPEPPDPPAPPGLADRPGVPLPDPPPPPFFLDGLCRSSSRCSFRSCVGFVIKSRPHFLTQLLIGPIQFSLPSPSLFTCSLFCLCRAARCCCRARLGMRPFKTNEEAQS